MGNPAAALQNKMAQMRGGSVSGPMNSGFTGGKVARPPMSPGPEMSGQAGFLSQMPAMAQPQAQGIAPGLNQRPQFGGMPPGYTGRGNAVRRPQAPGIQNRPMMMGRR